ncbi:MAG: hypothetical protein QM800_06410 [Paludibacter sp.]
MRFRRLELDQIPAAGRPLAERVLRVSADGLGGPFNLMLRSPAMGNRLMDLMQYFNDETTVLEPRTRRLAVLILARISNARYAWWSHSRRALNNGEFPMSVIDSLNAGRIPDDLEPRHAVAARFVVELLRPAGASDATFHMLREYLEEPEVVELITFCGTYTTVAFLLREGQVGLPADAVDTLLPVAAPFTD